MAEGEFYIEEAWLRKKLKGIEAKLDELETKLDSLSGQGGQAFSFWASSPNIVEDDMLTAHRLSIGVSTVKGIPAASNLTAGVASIWRVRDGTESLIVDEAACDKDDGQVWFGYNFPKTHWQGGDEYWALFTGQKIAVDSVDCVLPPVCLHGWVSRETSIQEQTDRLGGEPPESGSVAADWQSGMATSGEPGADLVSIGSADSRYKVHSLVIDISDLADGATVTVKLFMKVNGIERKVYSQGFTKEADPDGLWIVNGTVGIHEVLRTEVHSDNTGDDGKAVIYDYMLERMG